ncbi:hypothetical protein FA13DRAFT_1408562 [Coprinellus micaceus]|uniref:Uncharacterized protein n=1 Tax=Coprinellus micaceus TaxID=71717 RepID=A0A4Y7SPS3_COPMI|nr:hypothetical protein FA13DRAFT_1408562 [Coprinellus micaceus]
MARMQLISPPPEEVLRRVSSGSGSRHIGPVPTTPTPFMTSSSSSSVLAHANASARPQASTQDEPSPPGSSKRKRSAHVTPKPARVLPSHSSTTTREQAHLGEFGEGATQWARATPNPRLRKQVRRSPLDDAGEPGREPEDVVMASPTKAKAGRALPRGGVLDMGHGNDLGGGTMNAASANLTGKRKGKARKARESPAYEPPPDMYMIPIRHTTLSPPPEAARGAGASASAKAKGKQKAATATIRAKGRESIREEMQDEEGRLTPLDGL